MRTFSSGVSNRLAKRHGLEPVVFIGVQWGDQEVFYSTTDIAGAKKSILTISGLETTQQLQGTGATQSVTVQLSDTDGALTTVLNKIDIHKRPAKVYLGFPGLPVAEAATLLDGEINSEMQWDERARTLTFSILSKIEGRLFGFSAEDGLFHKVEGRSRTAPWPFRFGETCAYPAVTVRNGITGILRSGQGVLDPTIEAKICQAQKIECPLIEDPNVKEPEPPPEQLIASATFGLQRQYALNPDYDPSSEPFGQQVSGPFSGSKKRACGDTGCRTAPTSGLPLIPDPECQRSKFVTLCQLLRDRANQLVYVMDTLSIIGGNEFPQNELIRIRIDDIVYAGIMTGESFLITFIDNEGLPAGQVDCEDIDALGVGYRRAESNTPDSLDECDEPTEAFELRVVGGPGQAWRKLDNIADGKFKWLPAGSEVHLETSSTVVHVVSLVPGTIDGVFAYRTFEDTRQLTEVPTDYYEVVTTDYGDLEAVELWLDKPLSSYQNERWTDQIYVQYTSDIGPNPVDVIEWIVERYTDFTVDATNFAAVKALLTNYPCNYYHAKKTNVISVIDKIAYEARCALTITDNVVKLTYLPDEPTAVKTFTEADLVAGSFKFIHSRTEELVTSQEIQWQPWGASQLAFNPPERNFTVENNTQKYGFFGASTVYETITDEEQALKTATFWSIRDSNTWRIVQFQTTLEHMNLELFDSIQLNIGAFPNVKCVVRAMAVDPQNGTVDFECWTPILSGTTDEYIWAWPAQQNQLLLYPDANREVELPPIQLTPPEGHPLYIDDPNFAIPPTTGDRNPSDLDDVFPASACQDATQAELIDIIEPIFERFGEFAGGDPGQQSTRADEKVITADGLNWSGGGMNESENYVCGRPSFDDCVWEVTVGYVTAEQIGEVTACDGFDYTVVPGPCTRTKPGIKCSTSGGYTWCKTFGSDLMAQAFADGIQSQIESAFCSWRTGQQGPWFVVGPIKKAGNDDTCFGMGDVEVGHGSNQ